MTDLIPHPGNGNGPGRPPGSPNKIPRAVKEMVLDALDELGGKEYLKTQAIGTNASAFMTLIGKIIPLQIAGDPDNPIVTEQRLSASDKEIIERYLTTKGTDNG